MSIEIIRHFVDGERGMEVMDVRDSHGRSAQFQCGVLPGNPEPASFFDGCLKEFAAQEEALTIHKKNFKPRTLLVALFFLLLAPFAQAAPTITVSASAVTLLGSSQSISLTVQLIDPYNTGMLKVSGTGVVPIMRASTVTPGTTATVGPIYGNDVILNAFGVNNVTYYQVQVFTVNGGFISSMPALQNFYAFTGSGTIDLSTATPLVPNFMNSTAGVSIPGNFSVTGNLTATAGQNQLNAYSLNGLVVVDGIKYATIEAAVAALPSSCGACTIMLPPGFTETPAGNISISKNVVIVATGPGSIITGTNQIIFSAGLNNFGIVSWVPAGTTEQSGGTSGFVITHSGGTPAVVVGTSSSVTEGFAFNNVGCLLTNNAGSCLQVNQVITGEINHPTIATSGLTSGCTAIGIQLNGTGSQFTGNFTISNPQISGTNIGIQLTGSGTNGANINQIILGNMNSPCGSGSIGVDIEVGAGNLIYGFDAEGLANGYQLGASAQGNDLRVRSETNTHDLSCNASSGQNVFHLINGGSTVNFTGTCSGNSLDVDNRVFTANGVNVFITPQSGGGTVFLQGANVGVGGPIINLAATATMGLTLKTGSGSGNYTGTNTAAFASVDTTNLCTVITVPTGWKLKVDASATIESATGAVAQSFALADAGTTCTGGGVTALAGTERDVTPPALGTFDVVLHTQYIFSGDGAAHSFSLVAKTSNAADAWGVQNTSAAAAPSMTFLLMPSN